MQVKTGPLKFKQQACKRCGVCIELCPRQVFTADQEGYPASTNIEKCTRCRLCELWCPDYAIEVTEIAD